MARIKRHSPLLNSLLSYYYLSPHTIFVSEFVYSLSINTYRSASTTSASTARVFIWRSSSGPRRIWSACTCSCSLWSVWRASNYRIWGSCASACVFRLWNSSSPRPSARRIWWLWPSCSFCASNSWRIWRVRRRSSNFWRRRL